MLPVRSVLELTGGGKITSLAFPMLWERLSLRGRSVVALLFAEEGSPQGELLWAV
jgi:hypothetical protein